CETTQGQGNSMNWQFTLSTMLLLGIMSLGAKANYSLEYQGFEDKQIITFNGGFGKTSFKSAEDFLKKVQPNKPVHLEIHRGFGGDVNQHKKFVKLIREKCPKGKCVFTTLLFGQCSSMCATLFLSGDKRLAKDHWFANLGLHRTLIKVLGRRIPIQGPRSMARYFQKFEGVNKEYIWKNRKKFFKQPDNGLYQVHGQELIKAGFAHELIH
ncbi:MAG: hypothetical protein NXH75_11670, partial [Halobacteriovoraceae bacterium]|nr:hypothetical protein [Halobacteriovoraceae bacterium]